MRIRHLLKAHLFH